MLAFANWTFVATLKDFAATSATAAGDTVSGASTQGDGTIISDRATYAASPADVLDLQARPADAFADFPLVVT